MIKTLGLFLSSKERKMSRIAGQFDDTAIYEPDLFLQGMVIEIRYLKISMQEGAINVATFRR